MKPILFNFTDDELTTFLADLGQPKFRAKQIRDWLNRGAPDFASMKNLPESLRIQLDNIARTLPVSIVQKLDSSDGGTTKFLLECYGDAHRHWRGVDAKRTGGGFQNEVEDATEQIECVLMRTTYGNSVCVSSQAGCAMGCKFCASTLLGLKRNLTANEMYAQVLTAQWILRNEKWGPGNVQKRGDYRTENIQPNGDANSGDVSHVVVMGTGEPLQNTENTIEFMQRLHSDLGISWRKITVSTCGIVPGIKRLTEWGMPISLAISLHAPNDELRGALMPINAKYSIADVMEAAWEFEAIHHRQIMIEYILLAAPVGAGSPRPMDVSGQGNPAPTNCTPELAHELSKLLENRNCMVNLIPWNAVDERDFAAPSGNAAHRFQDILIANGIHTRIRRERGQDIGSACGQLRLNNAKK